MTTALQLQPLPELVPQLKRLRLSGLLESLPQRHRQAVAGQLSYPEFLALLMQDEIARREPKKFTLRVRHAGCRSQKTLSDFDCAYHPRINQAQILDLATCRFVAAKAAILIAGPCGTGKSHLAQVLGHEAARRDYEVLFTTQRRRLATHTYERCFQVLARGPLPAPTPPPLAAYTGQGRPAAPEPTSSPTPTTTEPGRLSP